MFYLPHGLTVDHENNVWVTDVGRHQVWYKMLVISTIFFVFFRCLLFPSLSPGHCYFLSPNLFPLSTSLSLFTARFIFPSSLSPSVLMSLFLFLSTSFSQSSFIHFFVPVLIPISVPTSVPFSFSVFVPTSALSHIPVSVSISVPIAVHVCTPMPLSRPHLSPCFCSHPSPCLRPHLCPRSPFPVSLPFSVTIRVPIPVLCCRSRSPPHACLCSCHSSFLT